VAELGKVLISLGLLLVLAGGLFLVVGRVPYLGRLPGDLAFQRGNFGVYFPIVTCLILSIVLTLALNLAGRLFR
jgi:Protein of unknown function (DUF2905)